MFCRFHTKHHVSRRFRMTVPPVPFPKGGPLHDPPLPHPPTHSLSIFASGLDGLVSRHFTRRKSRQAGRQAGLFKALQRGEEAGGRGRADHFPIPHVAADAVAALTPYLISESPLPGITALQGAGAT